MMESTIIRKETAVMRKQKTILPAVSILALPLGKRRGSTFRTARLQMMSVTFDRGSKIASAMVVNSDKEPEETAPYICKAARMRFAAKEPWIAILNFS